MSDIDSLAGELDAVSTGLARAHHVARAAVGATERIGTWASAAGFAGVAENVARVGEAVRQMQAGISALTTMTVEIRAKVADVPKQVSPQEAIEALAPVMDRVRELQQRNALLIEQVNRAGQLTADVLRGGQPGPMLARLDSIRQLLVEVAERTAAGRQHAETVLTHAADVGDLGDRPRVPAYPTMDHGPPTSPIPPTAPGSTDAEQPGAVRSVLPDEPLTTPSRQPDPAAAPRGPRTLAHPTKVDDQALRRENESADVLARNGYDIEQNPPPKPNGKQPDYRVESRHFDCYAPLSGEVDQIRKGISRKVKRDQTDRIVLNLADSSVPRRDVADILRRRPIANLKEIIVVDGERAVAFYPFQE